MEGLPFSTQGSKPPNKTFLEIACFNLESALAAASAGADRIEFCRDYSAGGLTPAMADLRVIKNPHPNEVAPGIQGPSGIAIPVNVMIRLRPGNDFTVNKAEALTMKTSIMALKPFASGFVFGVLDSEDNIDPKLNWDLVKLAWPKPCTFHRAFDHAKGDLYERLEIVRRCGFTTILTSGCPGNAIDGVEALARLVGFAEPMEMTILVGGGVRATNINELMDKTGAQAFHSAALTIPGIQFPDTHEIKRMRASLDGAPVEWHQLIA